MAIALKKKRATQPAFSADPLIYNHLYTIPQKIARKIFLRIRMRKSPDCVKTKPWGTWRSLLLNAAFSGPFPFK
jgi:hypothetical protein